MAQQLPSVQQQPLSICVFQSPEAQHIVKGYKSRTLIASLLGK